MDVNLPALINTYDVEGANDRGAVAAAYGEQILLGLLSDALHEATGDEWQLSTAQRPRVIAGSSKGVLDGEFLRQGSRSAGYLLIPAKVKKIVVECKFRTIDSYDYPHVYKTAVGLLRRAPSADKDVWALSKAAWTGGNRLWASAHTTPITYSEFSQWEDGAKLVWPFQQNNNSIQDDPKETQRVLAIWRPISSGPWSPSTLPSYLSKLCIDRGSPGGSHLTNEPLLFSGSLYARYLQSNKHIQNVRIPTISKDGKIWNAVRVFEELFSCPACG